MTDKVELKSSHEVIYTVDVADVDSIFQGKPIDPDILTVLMKDGKRLYCDEVCPIDSLQEENVSEDFIEFEEQYFKSNRDEIINVYDRHAGLVDGAKWKENQLMAKAVDAEVHIDAGGYPYIPQLELYDYDNDVPLAKEGDKYKVVLIKEE